MVSVDGNGPDALIFEATGLVSIIIETTLCLSQHFTVPITCDIAGLIIDHICRGGVADIAAIAVSKAKTIFLIVSPVV